MYRIEPFQPVDLPALTSLLDTSFNIQNATKESLIRWKFFDDYHADHTVSYLAFDQSDQVVSQYTNFPVSLTWGSHPLRGMICGRPTPSIAAKG